MTAPNLRAIASPIGTPGDDGGVYDMSLRRSYRLNPALLGETRVAEVKPAVPNETMARDDDDDVDVVP